MSKDGSVYVEHKYVSYFIYVFLTMTTNPGALVGGEVGFVRPGRGFEKDFLWSEEDGFEEVFLWSEEVWFYFFLPTGAGISYSLGGETRNGEVQNEQDGLVYFFSLNALWRR
jgi:hypothetical protein